MRACRIIAACWLVTAVVSLPAQSLPAQAQRIESGIVTVRDRAQSAAGGARTLRYSIRLLPVSSFPELPPPVAAWLSGRGCMIPQSYLAHSPDNVIRGSFERAGSSDWAVLCSVDGVSTLYVFFGSNPARPIRLRSQPDDRWLGIDLDWMSDYGSAWAIATHLALVMPREDRLNHDGIDDTDLDTSSTTTHYYKDGQWTVYNFGDQ